jgi:isoquinoline 1-oxidoreductase beta subunit
VRGVARLTRRSFIKGSVLAGAGLTIAFDLRGAVRLAAAPTEPFMPNAWIRITPDNVVTIIVDKSDMGQGVLTSMPMLIAEELEADWSAIKVEQAPANPKYGNPALGGLQLTGGSLSVRTSWLRFRKAGAAVKEMLVEAAAREWGVPPETCVAENSTILHPASGRRLTYGQLTDAASRLPVPENPTLKSPKDFKLIGKRVRRLENPPKIDGRAVYGIDVKVPDMLVATVARCPVFGGRVRTFDATAAKAVPGVRHVVQIDSGIAVVADGYWPAKLGRDALVIEWDEGPNASISSASIRKMFEELTTRPGPVARNEGDAPGALEGAAIRLDAIYEVPYLHHATMEPMTCTAHVRPDGCDVWVGTQWQDGTQNTAAKVANLSPADVNVHTTLLGGGFGRRFEQDFVAEAVAIAKAVRAPVKLIWSREDDTRHGFYRPTTFNRLSGGLDGNGMPIAWTHRIIGTSIATRAFPALVQDGIDATAIEGAANLPYAIPNLRVESIMKETGVPVGFWRSVGSSQNAYITECFLDELAAAGSKDPYELRRKLLPPGSRHRGVLELAATKAGWGTPPPPGRHRGIAVAESFGSWVAQVAEVSVSPEGEVRVHRIVCALDCGIVVNPDTVEAQMEGAITFGLTAALRGEITIDNGRVQQSNFHDYPMLRINEMPVVEVHIVRSAEPPGGVGEPGVPPVAPAVVNAIFAATGRHLRSLPISKHDLRRA